MHLRTRDALADGHVQLAIRTAVTVVSRGEVHASATFTIRPVALRAVTEKILAAGCQVGRRILGIFFRKIPVSPIRSFLPLLRRGKTHTCQEAEDDPGYLN